MMLITGGTGSLGQKLIEHFKDKHQIIVYSRDEAKQAELMRRYPGVSCIIGDVRDKQQISDTIEFFEPDIVIHTAALKRVETCEENPLEAVKTNILGTENVLNACYRNGVKKFLLVSTDKACKPINTYGMCKAIAEKLTVHYGYNCVRYGNVNNSKGSVIPLWKKMSKDGEKLGITNPTMTRFMIDFDEAIELIEKALVKMDGLIFIPKLDSAKIVDIAKLFSNRLKVVGERPGEKLHEELIHEEEFRGRVEEKKDHYIIHTYQEFDTIYDEYTSESSTMNRTEVKERLKAFLK